ncbi:hypothetical protein SAMN07250955_11149 [Arboricoccus pini]|uniref:Nitrile hydratase, alpha chain n=1 Tax=Arboricoccus pini TaxID=1963835 RepID=A0A212RN78_9PROT|nr:hypothetical protein [Arboricoccus pini]SNB73981.1 hypothetical protein SAMN07250955_11149 [Arboricoccus pini]
MARIRGGTASVLQNIGRVIAAATTDPVARKALLNDPEGMLVRAGIDPVHLAAKRVVVHEDTASTIHMVIPYELDSNRIADTDYLEDLGRAALGQCKEPSS